MLNECRTRALITLVSLFVFSSSIFAADDKGKFAVKGAGKRACSDFLIAYQKKNTDYYMYGGWLEGFISSYNQFQSGTYDAVPWQTTELLMALLSKHCQNKEQIPFLNATNAILRSLHPLQLDKESKVVKVALQNSESYYYRDVLILVQQRLAEMGLFNGAADGNFNLDSIEAMLNFQKRVGLTETGIPDQQTLVRLFLRLKQPNSDSKG